MAPASVLGPRHWVCGRNRPTSHLLEQGRPCSRHTRLCRFLTPSGQVPKGPGPESGQVPATTTPSPTTVSCRSTLLPSALLMALTQKLDPTHPWLSPPCEAQSFDPRPGVSAWSLSHLQQFPPEGFLMQRGCPPWGWIPGWASLQGNVPPLTTLWLPLSPPGHSGGHSEPCLDSGHRTLKLGLSVTFPGSSSPGCSQKTPSVPWASPSGGMGKGDCQTLWRDFQKLRWGDRLRGEDHTMEASGNLHLLRVIKCPAGWREGWQPEAWPGVCKAQNSAKTR